MHAGLLEEKIELPEAISKKYEEEDVFSISKRQPSTVRRSTNRRRPSLLNILPKPDSTLPGDNRQGRRPVKTATLDENIASALASISEDDLKDLDDDWKDLDDPLKQQRSARRQTCVALPPAPNLYSDAKPSRRRSSFGTGPGRASICLNGRNSISISLEQVKEVLDGEPAPATRRMSLLDLGVEKTEDTEIDDDNDDLLRIISFSLFHSTFVYVLSALRDLARQGELLQGLLQTPLSRVQALKHIDAFDIQQHYATKAKGYESSLRCLQDTAEEDESAEIENNEATFVVIDDVKCDKEAVYYLEIDEK
jgi:hypothetical protein